MADDDFTAIREDVALFDHSDAGWIELTEADARSFLNNLSTNDIKNLKDGDGCELFLTNAKARIVGHGIVTAHGDRLRLEVEPGRAAVVFKHLDHYLISERVELTDRSAELCRMTLLGPRSAEVVEKATGLAVADLGTWSHRGGVVTVCRQRLQDPAGLRSHRPRGQRSPSFGRAWPTSAPRARWRLWETLRIEVAGRAGGHEIDEQRFVVETGRTRRRSATRRAATWGQEPIVMARDRLVR